MIFISLIEVMSKLTSIQNEEMNMEGNAQEQHDINNGHGANEMEVVRNKIATSLMTIHSP